MKSISLRAINPILAAVILAPTLGCATAGDVQTDPDDPSAEVLGGDGPVDSDADAGLGEVQQGIIGGQLAWGQPEIVRVDGPLGFCSGTLVATRVVLTAAHCVTGEHRVGSPITVRVFSSNGASSTPFAVQTAYYNPAYNGYVTDVGLLKLSHAVPSSVAKPRAMTNGQTPNGTHMTVWGYASTSRTGDVQVGKKHFASYFWPTNPGKVWFGDSGGPTIRGDKGYITRVNSAVGQSGATWIDYTAPLNANWTWIKNTMTAIQ